MSRVKAKKATAGERHVAKWTSQTIHFIRNDENSMIEAAELDRAIAAAVRKERKRCVAVIEKHQAASFTGAVRHEAFVCDDLIAAIREANP